MKNLTEQELKSIQGGWYYGLFVLAAVAYVAEVVKEVVVEGTDKCIKDFTKGYNKKKK